MKSIYDASIREEITLRINKLSDSSQAQWGKMNVKQMVKHSAKCEEMLLGELKIERVFIGKLIGKMVLRKSLKDEKPFKKNSPTSPLLKIAEPKENLDTLKKQWISKIEQYSNYSENGIIHPFFGRMSKAEIGKFSYKHADHHLRQFGA